MTPPLPFWEIRNTVLPNGTKAAIQIRGRAIAGIGESVGCAEFLDAQGLHVVPGLINTHVHFRTPEEEYKEDWSHAAAASLSSGVTTVFDMPNHNRRPTTSFDSLLKKEELIGDQPIDYRFWFGSLPDNTGEFPLARNRPRTVGAKTYYDLSTGGLIVRKKEDRRKIALACGENGWFNAVHAEAWETREKNAARFPNPAVSDHCLIRDSDTEIIGIEQALEIQAETGVAMIINHVSTPRGLELIDNAKQHGRPVYAETCPHYLFLWQYFLQGPNGAFFKMNPALRTYQEMCRMVELLCRGFVDIIGTDHAPHTEEEKRRQTYAEIPSGIPGEQTLFPLMYSLVASGRVSLHQFIRLTSTNAAELFHLKKGRLEIGYDADLVLYEPGQEVVFALEEQFSKCGWSPYAIAGMAGVGKPKVVISRGILRFYDGKVLS